MVSVGARMVGGGSFCGDWRVFALGMYFKEFMLTSPPELAHCGGGGPSGKFSCVRICYLEGFCLFYL